MARNISIPPTMKPIKNILAISGRQGLFNLITQTRTGILVESLNDMKRFTISAQQQVHALDEIAIYCKEGEKPIKDLYEKIGKSLNGEKSVSHKANNPKILAAFTNHVPDYDEDRVYISDMKKFFNWYNMLCGYGFFLVEKDDEKEIDLDIKDKGSAS
ncbi:MAG: Uncharacterised protein [Owenweeksia sp. TMED14]|nr:MAG: Uncharacterised protein [Owenweeksia sp. TMED14]